MKKQNYLITAETGIHARPATLLVNKAGQYTSEINLTYKDKTVNLKSIMGVMSLGISKGAEIEITVDGNDEDEAIAGITAVIEEHLGEKK
ncbi:phosphocarrier protein HPr [Compostibacillus humi]|uniref:Phosphocarrier protein HPr n=1 Tax=Compostibacillus humi TaxID=1245525 RepID=A0A8J2TQV3_9BACI|nr:phosphocarrier protein HPr [Compostibacillus humi]GFZ83228.1 phosphocarrier protein HPr [Compostibacillus humi]HLT56932.1 phosphocarrier protein HPr [Bacillota bacterium]